MSAQLQLDGVRLPSGHQIAPGSIETLLPHGMENAVAAADLARLAGCRDARELRRRVAAERANGALVLSLPSVGYFLPDEGEKGRREADHFIRSMASRARQTMRATAAARDYLTSEDSDG